jgi:hypothetical protein
MSRTADEADALGNARNGRDTMPRKRLTVLCVAAALCALAATTAFGYPDHSQLRKVKQATAKYHNVETAKAAGYGLLLDAQGIACIDMPRKGAMGVHYVNGTLVGDGAIDAFRPEAVVYEPGSGTKLRIVAIEYVVFKADWDKNHKSRPKLFGRRFDLTTSPNRYGLPAFYSLHAWIFRDNPAGTFAMWNPRVKCPGGSGGHGGHGH